MAYNIAYVLAFRGEADRVRVARQGRRLPRRRPGRNRGQFDVKLPN
jgi:hypothetical protein